MEYDLKKEISRVSNLKQNKGKSPEEMERQASVNLKVRDFKAKPLFTDAEEIKLSIDRFRKYLETNELESMGDIDTLRSLIYLEVFETRIQNQLNKLKTEDKAPYEKITKQLTDVQNQKMSIKIKLSIDKDVEEDSDLTKLQMLEKRFDRYILEHRNEFTLSYTYKCKKCDYRDVEMVLVRKRVKDFSAMKHPWFVGRWLFNYEILKDVKNKVITKEQAWRYLCSASEGGNSSDAFSEEYCHDYIDWVIQNWAKITKQL